MTTKRPQRSFFQRLLGISTVKPPADGSSWTYSDNRIILELIKAPELSKPGSAICLEGDKLLHRILVIHGLDGKFYAYRNSCPHSGKKLDPVPGMKKLESCGLSKTIYDYSGKPLSGPGKQPLTRYSIKDESQFKQNITVFRNFLERLLSIDLKRKL